MTDNRRDRLVGLLLGEAVGDALGLPAEGLSKRRVQRMYPGRLRHRFLFGRGMISDDTEHAFLTAQCLLAHPNSADDFARGLAWRLRLWLLGLPAGIGLATLRAILRLWVGVPPSRSGVFSAGNGPAMRAPIVGAVLAENPQLFAYVQASTRLTHTDPKALIGSMAVARVAAWCLERQPDQRLSLEEFLALLRDCGEDGDWEELVAVVGEAARDDLSVEDFAQRLGLEQGVSGYIYHTVPVALYAWYRHFGDFEATVTSVIRCGGDTDTAGAVAGALAGAVTGEAGIPQGWPGGICDWPRSTDLLRRVAEHLSAAGRGPVPYCALGVLPRNILFLAVVLLHGFRRLLPPY